jgi:hypothetical protein
MTQPQREVQRLDITIEREEVTLSTPLINSMVGEWDAKISAEVEAREMRELDEFPLIREIVEETEALDFSVYDDGSLARELEWLREQNSKPAKTGYDQLFEELAMKQAEIAAQRQETEGRCFICGLPMSECEKINGPQW